MSNTYPDLTGTSFPESIDVMTRMSDLEIEDWQLIYGTNGYYYHYNQGNLNAARMLLETNPSLLSKIFNAEKFNRLHDCIVAVQRYFLSNSLDGTRIYPVTTAILVPPSNARINDLILNGGTGTLVVCGKSLIVGAMARITSLTPFTLNDIEGNIRGADGEGTKTFAVTGNTSAAPTGARVGDLFLNSGTAAYTIAGISNVAIGGIVEITAISPLAGVSKGNIRGAAGSNGSNGVNGATWLNGAVSPISTQGNINDWYLNTVNWDVYKKTTSTAWSLQGNIKGLEGSVPGGIADIYFSRTYSQLRTLVNSNALVAGSKYVLTDYVTKYRQPYTNVIKIADIVQGDTTTLESAKYEPLVLTAISNNKFDVICSSLSFPQDIIYYDFDDNLCEDGITGRRGFIQRRIDTKYIIDAPNDWRTILWARFKADGIQYNYNTMSAGSVYNISSNLYYAIKNGSAITTYFSDYSFKLASVDDYRWYSTDAPRTGMVINTADYAERYTFNMSTTLTTKTPTKFTEINSPRMIKIKGASAKSQSDLKGLANNVFMFTGSSFGGNNAGFNFYNNTFCGTQNNSTFENHLYGLNIGGSGDSNHMGSWSQGIVTGGSFSHNSIGSHSYNSTFGAGFQGNDASIYFQNCHVSDNCQFNTFGSSCSSLKIGSGFQYNAFLSRNSNLTIGNNMRYCTILAWVTNKDFSNYSSIYNSTKSITIQTRAGGTCVATYYDSSNVQQVIVLV